MKHWVDEQVEEKGFGTPSELIQDLIRERQRLERYRRNVNEKLARAVRSGPATPMTPTHWRKLRTEGIKRLHAAKAKRG